MTFNTEREVGVVFANRGFTTSPGALVDDLVSTAVEAGTAGRGVEASIHVSIGVGVAGVFSISFTAVGNATSKIGVIDPLADAEGTGTAFSGTTGSVFTTINAGTLKSVPEAVVLVRKISEGVASPFVSASGALG